MAVRPVTGAALERYPGDLLVHLRSFALVAQRVRTDPRRAFESTATALGLDPSVLRRRLRALSEALGTALFEGRGASLRLTEAGERAADTAGRISRDLDQLFAATTVAPKLLRFASTGTVTNHLLPEVIAELRSRDPNLVVQVRRAGAVLACSLVERGEVDLAVVRARSAPRGVTAKRLCADRLWLALPKDHPLLSRRTLSVELLAKLPLVTFGERSSTRKRVLSVLGPHGVEPSVEVDGRAPALRYVACGLGAAYLSFLPSDSLADPAVQLRDVTRLFPPSSFWIVHRHGSQRTFPVKTAIALLNARVRPRNT